ncbi:MAG TPA: hypothetical protein VGZ73_10690 [Bryobacteraceae bacterium]|nr:hypothetical protein [Bryobacteraceae bacterium]
MIEVFDPIPAGVLADRSHAIGQEDRGLAFRRIRPVLGAGEDQKRAIVLVEHELQEAEFAVLKDGLTALDLARKFNHTHLVPALDDNR